MEEVNSDGEGENKVEEYEFDINAPLDDDDEEIYVEARENNLTLDNTRDPEATCDNTMPA